MNLPWTPVVGILPDLASNHLSRLGDLVRSHVL